MIIGYARVSTLEQSYTHALDQQCERLRKYGVDEIITDVESGKSDKRVGFNRLMALIEKEEGLVVVSTRIDRLTRSLITLKRFFNLCDSHSVKVVVLDDNIDTRTAAGKFNLNVLGALAEMESDRLSERVSHGHAHHRHRKAAYNPPFGYKKIDDKLYLDKDPFLCCDGKTWSCYDIARYRIEKFLEYGSLRKTLTHCNDYFGIKDLSRFRKHHTSYPNLYVTSGGFPLWLNNPLLRGHLVYGRTKRYKLCDETKWEFHYNTHDALMSEDEWLTIKDILITNAKQNKNKDGVSTVNHPFSGLLRCNVCKGSMTPCSYRVKDGRRITYRCRSAKSLKICTNTKYVAEQNVRNYVANVLIEKAEQITQIVTSQKSKLSPEKEKLVAQLEQLKLIANPSEPILKAMNDLRGEIEKVDMDEKVGDMVANKNHQELVRVFGDPVFWSEYVEPFMSPVELRSFYKKFITAIWIESGQTVGVDWSI